MCSCPVVGGLASVMQCLGHYGIPAPVCCGRLGVLFVSCCWFVGGFCDGVTPGPFPNPEAKPIRADGTALGRVWESRSPPALIFNCV